MHSTPCIINNLQGLCLRPPSDCELTQDSDRKNAHNLDSIDRKWSIPVDDNAVSRDLSGEKRRAMPADPSDVLP